ncbi:MAG TPA: MAPEG family protein [Burkholderiales bacterium]|nr:MAPEG family protein [Burkholderiales bacterium]
MKPELMLLLWAVALTVVQMLIAVSGATLQVGLPKLASNRDNMPPLTGWVGRADRAHHNMLENLALFASLVLIAVVAGKTNSTTLLGAQLFFWGRLGYAVVYLIGIPWLRTGVWTVSIVGLLLIFLQLAQ